MAHGRRFHFHPVASGFAAVGLAVLVSLGVWQLQRLDWKRGLIAAVEARAGPPAKPLAGVRDAFAADTDVHYQRVVVSGRYGAEEAHVFGTLAGKPGYYVFAPFRTDAGATLVVNRGFVPQDRKAPDRRPPPPAERVAVTALFRERERKQGLAAVFAPPDDPSANVYYARDPARFGFPGDPPDDWYLDSLGLETTADAPRGGTTRIDFSNRHLEYALTWFGLAATLIGVYIAYGFRGAPDDDARP